MVTVYQQSHVPMLQIQGTQIANKKIDTYPPLITINGDLALTLEAGANYTELGAKATEDEDGDLSDSILVTGEAITKIPRVYNIFYGL